MIEFSPHAKAINRALLSLLIFCIFTIAITSSDYGTLFSEQSVSVPLLGISVGSFSFFFIAPITILITQVYLYGHIRLINTGEEHNKGYLGFPVLSLRIIAKSIAYLLPFIVILLCYRTANPHPYSYVILLMFCLSFITTCMTLPRNKDMKYIVALLVMLVGTVVLSMIINQNKYFNYTYLFLHTWSNSNGDKMEFVYFVSLSAAGAYCIYKLLNISIDTKRIIIILISIALFSIQLIGYYYFQNNVRILKKNTDIVGFDLKNINLDNYDLSGFFFSNTNIIKSSFKNTNLKNAQFNRATIINTNLYSSNMIGTSFFQSRISSVNINGVSLENSNIVNTVFKNARFLGATFDDSKLWNVEFIESNLSFSSLIDVLLWNVKLSRTDVLNALIFPLTSKQISITDNILNIYYRNSEFDCYLSHLSEMTNEERNQSVLRDKGMYRIKNNNVTEEHKDCNSFNLPGTISNSVYDLFSRGRSLDKISFGLHGYLSSSGSRYPTIEQINDGLPLTTSSLRSGLFECSDIDNKLKWEKAFKSSSLTCGTQNPPLSKSITANRWL